MGYTSFKRPEASIFMVIGLLTEALLRDFPTRLIVFWKTVRSSLTNGEASSWHVGANMALDVSRSRWASPADESQGSYRS